MAKQSGLNHRFYVHGYDLSGDIAVINGAGSTSAIQEVTGLDKSAYERIYGLEDGKLSFNCFFNDASSQEHAALKALPRTDRLIMWLLGVTAGAQVACLLGKQMDYDWNRGADGALMGTVNAKGNGYALEWALLLKVKGTHASPTDETGINYGSQTTAGAVGFLQHFSAASGTVEYDIEDSSDSTNGVDGVWANLLAFTDVATPYAPTAERVAVAGTVEKWTRASTNGTFTNAAFSIALKRN